MSRIAFPARMSEPERSGVLERVFTLEGSGVKARGTVDGTVEGGVFVLEEVFPVE